MALYSHITPMGVLTYLDRDARLAIQMSQSEHHAYQARFLIMIEFTTGVAFLMSSLYGAGQADSHVANIAAVAQSGKSEQAITSQVIGVRPLKNEKDIEVYMRKQYADKPILGDIAWCESRFHQFNEDGTVVRGEKNKADIGIMQINEKYHADTADKLNLDIYTAEGNIAFGKYLYGKYGTKPWSSSSKCWSQELAKK